MDTGQIKERLRELFSSQRLAVLSTSNGDQPYASLVAFDATPDLDQFFFLTPKTTRKFENIIANPRVSFLVHNSENRAHDIHQATAVTGLGRAVPVKREDAKETLVRYLEKHPGLDAFSRSPDTACVCVSMDRYVLVKQFQNVVELNLGNP